MPLPGGSPVPKVVMTKDEEPMGGKEGASKVVAIPYVGAVAMTEKQQSPVIGPGKVVEIVLFLIITLDFCLVAKGCRQKSEEHLLQLW